MLAEMVLQWAAVAVTIGACPTCRHDPQWSHHERLSDGRCASCGNRWTVLASADQHVLRREKPSGIVDVWQ